MITIRYYPNLFQDPRGGTTILRQWLPGAPVLEYLPGEVLLGEVELAQGVRADGLPEAFCNAKTQVSTVRPSRPEGKASLPGAFLGATYPPGAEHPPIPGSGDPSGLRPGSYVSLNGRPLRGAEVEELVPVDGDRIECGRVPGIIAALIGAAAMAEISTLTAIGVAVADAIIISALSMGIGYGISAIMGPQAIPKFGKSEDGPSRSWAGIQDTIGNGQPIPFGYGKVRVGGQILQSYERQAADGHIPSSFSAGLEVPEQWIHGEDGKTILNTLIGICYGPIKSISEIQIDGNAIEDIANITYETRLGTADQAPLTRFGSEIITEKIYAREIEYEGESSYPGPEDEALPDIWADYTTFGEVDAFEVIFRFPQGLYRITTSGMGPMSVLFDLRYRPFGSSDTWLTTTTKTITAEVRGSPFKGFFRAEGLKRSQYQIQIRRRTPNDVTKSSLSTVSISEIYAINEILWDHRSHPGMAMIAFSQLPSEQFSSNAPSNYTFVAELFDDVRTYTTLTDYTVGWSENNGWCLAHFITHADIGLGHLYSWDDIDLPSFLAFAAYCDFMVSDGKGGLEKRCTIGHLFDQYQSAQDILSVFTQGSGAMLILSGGKWRVVLDEPDEMIWLGGEGNIVPGSFRMEWLEARTRANRILGTFLDRDYDYQRESAQVQDLSIGQGTSIVETSRELFGVTRRSQVERELTRYLLHNKFAGRKVELEGGLDALRVVAGSIFGISVPVTGSGIASGRVLAIYATAPEMLDIDAEVTIEAGSSYELTLLHQEDGSIESKKVANNPGTGRRIYLVDPTWIKLPAEGDIYSIHANEIVKFRCISSAVGSELRRKISGMEYNPSVYTFDLTLPANPPATSIPDPRKFPPDAENVSVFERQEYQEDGSLADVIDVSWTRPVSAILDCFEVYYRTDAEGTSWVLSGMTSNPHWEIRPVICPGETYWISVVSVSISGMKKSPGQSPGGVLTTQGLLDQPSTLGGLTATIIDGTLVATCDPAPEGELGPAGYYEWRTGGTWAQSRLIDKTSAPRLETRSYARGGTTILVKAVNSVGNSSPEAASISITLYGQIDENIILTQSEATAWTGTKEGLAVSAGKLSLYEPNVSVVYIPGKPETLRGARFLSFGYPPPTAKIVLEGFYTTAPITVSDGNIVLARADVATAYNPIAIGLGTFDQATWAFDSAQAQIPFSGDEPDKVQVIIESRVSTTDTAEGSWSAWAEHRQRAEISMRYIQFRLHVTVDTDAYSVEISTMNISIDLPEKIYATVHEQLSANSFDEDYPADYFVAVKRLLVSVIGGAVGDTVRVTAQDETGFTGEIRTSAGALTAGSVHYEALGY